MTLRNETVDLPRWTMQISACRICDKGIDPMEIPDELCGHSREQAHMLDVAVVPEKTLRALLAAVEEERRWATGSPNHLKARDRLYRLTEATAAALPGERP